MTALQRVAFHGVEFDVDPSRPGDPAWFVLGVRKSGSSMFNRAAKLLARFNEVNWIDLPGTLFEQDVPVPRWRDSEVPTRLLRGGNVYGGFRDCPGSLSKAEVFEAGLKVLLVRDPRDAIVSEYFSTARTHSLPEGGGDSGGAREDLLRRRKAALAMDVEQFARAEAGKMARTMERYVPLLEDDRLLLLRYEDVIFDKARMIDDVVRHFGWTIRPAQMEAVLKWIDVVPDRENPDAFIRKVTPGDHLEKLSPETIATLNAELAAVMEAFGYR